MSVFLLSSPPTAEKALQWASLRGILKVEKRAATRMIHLAVGPLVGNEAG